MLPCSIDEVVRYMYLLLICDGQINEFPTKVILFCQVPPPEGGETPFVPSFRVTERMLEEYPDNVREMEEKGLRYTFTAVSKNDTTSMRGRGWEDAFGTSDPVEAERRYHRPSRPPQQKHVVLMNGVNGAGPGHWE